MLNIYNHELFSYYKKFVIAILTIWYDLKINWFNLFIATNFEFLMKFFNASNQIKIKDQIPFHEEDHNGIKPLKDCSSPS